MPTTETLASRKVRHGVKYALLGLLLQDGRLYGYRLAQRVEVLLGDAAAISPGLVYTSLDALELDGLIEEVGVQRGSGKRSARVLYAVTEVGVDVLAEWFQDHYKEPIRWDLPGVGGGAPAPGGGAADLTLTQAVGQRIVVSLPGTTVPDTLTREVRNGEVAGVILFGRNIASRTQLRALTARLQAERLNRIEVDRDLLRAADEAPFAALARRDVPLTMVSTGIYPALSSRPAMFAPAIATGELRDAVGFGGVSITDDLEVPALAHLSPERKALAAVRAGDDLLLFAQSATAAQRGAAAVRRAVANGALSRAAIDAGADRVLALRERLR
jgi:DNA-binding PadR family transcriptional regulator